MVTNGHGRERRVIRPVRAGCGRWRTRRRLSRPLAVVAGATGLALAAAGCSSSHADTRGGAALSGKPAKVTIEVTAQGCAPKPAKVPEGTVIFTVADKNTAAVSEAELRTSDMLKVLGEQENLAPGLTGGFSANIQPGSYRINCPGAVQPHWVFTVTGKNSTSSWQSNRQLALAVRFYAGYVIHNVSNLVSHTETFCQALDGGRMSRAKVLYPKARIYYERIEPVAEIWGSLDTQIDGRWENPVTVPSQFIGFHKIEQLLWEDNTLAGTPKLCAGLVRHEQQLLALVRTAQYNPLEMASGATDLINEAATSKITGEEERYSNTDLPVFQANVDAAMEVVGLLQPYLQGKDPGLLTQIRQREATVRALLAKYQAKPGYDDTGYVEYSTVLASQRRQLATAVNAFGEALSQLSVQVSN
jgi:iron uptake system component EfeO